MPASKQTVSQDARVAVIGLGAAGIAAVIGLRNAGLRNITVFEATGHAGGTWVYSGNIKNARSSMYKSLRCNIPKESMCYVGRPFHELADSFVSHRDVAAYLQRIADEENLLPLVRFNSPVARLFPVDPDRFETGWGIQTWAKQGASSAAVDENDHQNSATPSRAQFGTDEFGVTSLLSDVEYFDAVVVCNGHFTGALRFKRYRLVVGCPGVSPPAC
jgi:monoamine oxidase